MELYGKKSKSIPQKITIVLIEYCCMGLILLFILTIDISGRVVANFSYSTN